MGEPCRRLLTALYLDASEPSYAEISERLGMPVGSIGPTRARCLRRLRAGLVLRHMEGLSYAEVAQAMQVPIGTAKGWASRGRAAMLVVLSEARSNGPPPGKTVRPDIP